MLLYESRFYQFSSSDYKLWSQYIVQKTGKLLKQLVHQRSVGAHAYDIGTQYFTVLDSGFQLLGKILMSEEKGKIACILFHQILTEAVSDDLRRLMMKVWEFLDHEDLEADVMVFYIENTIENHHFISMLLKNLSWLNGTLLKPEGFLNLENTFKSLHWCDENYVILQFEV